jgi:hypothetical protein
MTAPGPSLADHAAAGQACGEGHRDGSQRSSRPHDRPRQLRETAEVLSTLVRNILLKRALHAADPNPRLNFWRIQYGNLMDLAVIDWCKLFGSDDAERQPIHWKTIADDQYSFRSALLKALAMTHEDWQTYWQDMKKYRDFTAAHHDPRRAEIATYPVLDKALDSAFFYFEYIQQEMRKLGAGLQPTDMRKYATAFEANCLEVARIALESTKDIPETVGPMRPG